MDTVDRAFLWRVVDCDKHESLYGWLVDLDRLAGELGMTVLLVHHMRKKQNQYRYNV